MKRYLLFTGSVTFAQKGKEYLQRRGINATVKRIHGASTEGCGYAIVVSDRALPVAKKLLAEQSIPVREIREAE